MTNVATAPRLDARPIRPVSSSTLWDEAVARRDAFAESIRKTLAARNVEALVFESEVGNYPPWVRFEAWTPVSEGARNRADLEIVVDVRPYRETPIVVTARFTRGGRRIEATEWPDFSVDDVADWTNSALLLRGGPAKYRPFRDWLGALAASLLPFLSKPHANPIARAYRPSLVASLAVALGWIGVIGGALSAFDALSAAISSDDADGSRLSLLFFVIAAAVAILAGVWLSRRARPDRHAVAVVPQPMFDPRTTRLVDSWSAVIAGLGADFENIRKRLVDRLRTDETDAGVISHEETYGHRVPNGFEVRNRFVVAKHQAYVYVHFQRFGDDMFVGWQAFLNFAQWAETVPVSTKIQERRQIEFRELRRAYYQPTHIDIVELNALSERVHRKLERELKTILREKQIDQEIDFKVIRGDRESALAKSEQGDQKPGRKGGLRFVGFGGKSEGG